jgi:predicted Fe-Mo cluster-binding NifX family protein
MRRPVHEREDKTLSENMLIAVPIESGEGLDAVRSAHFGHAAGFVLVEVGAKGVGAVRTIANPPHSQGGCMTTVNLLAKCGVTTVSAAGMGGGPLNGLADAGIAVHFDPESPTARLAVAAVLDGRTTQFGKNQVCQGH